MTEEIVSGMKSESEEVVDANKKISKYSIKVRMTQFHKFELYKIDTCNPLMPMTTYLNDLINNDPKLDPPLSKRTWCSWREQYKKYKDIEESNKYFPTVTFLLSDHQDKKIIRLPNYQDGTQINFSESNLIHDKTREIVSGTESESEEEEVVDSNKKKSKYPIKVRMTQFHKFELYKIDTRNPLMHMTTYLNDFINNDPKLDSSLSIRTWNSWGEQYKKYKDTEESDKYFPTDTFLLSDYQKKKIIKENATETLRFRNRGKNRKRELSDLVTNKRVKKSNNNTSSGVLLPKSFATLSVNENNQAIIPAFSDKTNNNESSKPLIIKSVKWKTIEDIKGLLIQIFSFVDTNPILFEQPLNKFYWNFCKGNCRHLKLNKFDTFKYEHNKKFRDTFTPSEIDAKNWTKSSIVDAKFYYCPESNSWRGRPVEKEENVTFGSFVYNIHSIKDPRSLDMDEWDVIQLNIETEFKGYPLFANCETSYNSARTYIKFTSPKTNKKMYFYICDIKIRKVELSKTHTPIGILVQDLINELNQILGIDDSKCFFKFERSLDNKRCTDQFEMPEFNNNKTKPFYFKLNHYSVIILDVKNEINPNRTISGVPKIQTVKEVLSAVPSAVASPAALSTSLPTTNTTKSNHDNYYDTRSSVESSSDEDDNINHNSNNVESSDNNCNNNNSTYHSKHLNFVGDNNNISSNNQREEDLLVLGSGEEDEMEVETENKTDESNNSANPSATLKLVDSNVVITNVVLKGLKNVENTVCYLITALYIMLTIKELVKAVSNISKKTIKDAKKNYKSCGERILSQLELLDSLRTLIEMYFKKKVSKRKYTFGEEISNISKAVTNVLSLDSESKNTPGRYANYHDASEVLFRFLDSLNDVFNLLDTNKTLVNDIFYTSIRRTEICNDCGHNCSYNEEKWDSINLYIPEIVTELNIDRARAHAIPEYTLLELIQKQFKEISQCGECREGNLRISNTFRLSDIVTFKIVREGWGDYTPLELPADIPHRSTTRSNKPFSKAEGPKGFDIKFKVNKVSFPLTLTNLDLADYISNEEEKMEGSFHYDLFSVVHYDWDIPHYYQYYRDIATNTWQELNDESIEIVYEISGTDLPEMDPSTSNLLLYKKRKD